MFKIFHFINHSVPNMPRRTYANHQNSALIEFKIHPNDSNEVLLMKKSLKCFIDDLLQIGVNKSHNFDALRRKHKIKSKKITEYIQLLNSLIIKNDDSPSNRQINHFNYSQKNVILTYHAYFNPIIMFVVFKKYVNQNLTEISNKEDLFEDMKQEIELVCGSPIDIIDTNFNAVDDQNASLNDHTASLNNFISDPLSSLSQSLRESDIEISPTDTEINNESNSIINDNKNDYYFVSDSNDNDEDNIFDANGYTSSPFKDDNEDTNENTYF